MPIFELDIKYNKSFVETIKVEAENITKAEETFFENLNIYKDTDFTCHEIKITVARIVEDKIYDSNS